LAARALGFVVVFFGRLIGVFLVVVRRFFAVFGIIYRLSEI
jgi:hypothetical protein